MVVFGQKWLIWSKIGCIRAKWLYSGKVVVFGQGGCFWAKVVVFGQKWLHLGKSGCNGAIVVLYESGLIWAR